ncbi:MAG: hypothetical protein Q9204_003199 [Flavoplaca sp. TL-2023a]
MPPDREEVPLCPSGVFSSSSTGGKYICERKFSVSWTGRPGPDEPTLMVVLSPLRDYISAIERQDWKTSGTSPAPPGFFWIEENLSIIVHEWEKVLNALDAQITLSSSMIFDGDARQKLLFDDRNFSNSKKYFWALQSLKIFAECIDGTLRIILSLVVTAEYYDGKSRDYTMRHITIDKFRNEFETLRDRIERKMQEVQILRDGRPQLFSASSVAEGRIANEQSGNIRLLTMVTIAYLPLNFATSIYGMDALPSSANLLSYVVVTILLCVITYILILNLPHLKHAMSWSRNKIYHVLRPSNKIAVEQDIKNHERETLSDSAMA